MTLPAENLEAIRPKLGQFIFPLASLFKTDHDGNISLRGSQVESKLLVHYFETLHRLKTPNECNPNLPYSIAVLCALNPLNRPTNFTVGHWEEDISVRKKYWLTEFSRINEAVIASATNTFEHEEKRFEVLLELLETEDLEAESIESLVELYKLGVA
ncbi:MAG: hypothetical protein O2984_02780 [Bacteroidetes bacterium]|nr:hypothetical protein [Bacteroidota bacterium]